MNAQSISPSLSLSQSFLMKFGSTRQPNQNDSIKNTQQNTSSNRLAQDSYQPSKIDKLNNGLPVNMQKHDMSFTRTESINMQFTTKEGDVVKISFNRTASRGRPSAENKEQQQAVPVKSDKQNVTINAQASLNISGGSNKPSTDVVKQNDQPSANQSKKPASVANITKAAELAVNKAPTSLVASRQSDFQIEKGDKKITGSKSEKYTFESNNAQPKEALNKEVVSKAEVNKTQAKKKLEFRNVVKPAKAEPSKIEADKDKTLTNDAKLESTDAKINMDDKVESKPKPVARPVPTRIRTTEVVKPQAAVDNSNAVSNNSNANVNNNGNIVTNNGNTVQMQQSFDGVQADGGSVSFSSEFSLNIEGDLNPEELQSITNLMNAMSEISQGFFQGTAGNAFSHADNMGFETDQIAGFSMGANKQQSVKAVAAYQQTAMPEQNVNTNALSEAGEFLSQAKEVVADSTVAVESFAEPKNSFVDMFVNIGQLFNNSENKQDDHGDMFLKIIENISSDFFDRKQAA